jgi:hypothetical protein
LAHSREGRRFTIIVRGTPIDLAFWIKMAFAICILFIIPFEVRYYEAIQPEPASNFYDIWISSVIMDYIDWRDRGLPPVNYSTPLTIASAIAICIPAILLNRRIRNQDLTKSIRDAGLATFFGTAVLTIYLVERFPPFEMAWLIQEGPAWKLLRFGSLVMVALIILPLIMREASHRHFQRKHRILACVIGVFSTLVPAGMVASNSGDFANYTTTALSYNIWYEVSIPSVPWQAIAQVNVAFTVVDPMNLLYIFVYIGLHLLFGFSILRYLQGVTSRRRVFLGASSILIPYIVAYPWAVLDAQFPTVVIPLPILFIVGIIVIVAAKPITELQTEYLGEVGEPISDLSESEVNITVPVVYMIKSKFLGVKRKIARLRDRS